MASCFGIIVYGLVFRAYCLWFSVCVCMVYGVWFGDSGLGLRVYCLGFGVCGLAVRD